MLTFAGKVTREESACDIFVPLSFDREPGNELIRDVLPLTSTVFNPGADFWKKERKAAETSLESDRAHMQINQLSGSFHFFSTQ